MNFDQKIEDVLDQYQQRMLQEEELWDSIPDAEKEGREDEFLLAVGRDAGAFMNSLIKSAQSKVILELGTSYGYSTVYLAEGARSTGGKVISLELQQYKVDCAKKQIANAGLEEFVEFRVGDAIEILKDASEEFDFVLLDIWKHLYLPCFELFYPQLSKGAWVISDNMLYPLQFLPEATAYRNRIRATEAFDSVLLPIGNGLETSYLR